MTAVNENMKHAAVSGASVHEQRAANRDSLINAARTARDIHIATGVAGVAKAVFAPLGRMVERRRLAVKFDSMNDRLLDDIGLNRYDVEASVLTSVPRQTFGQYISSVADAVRDTMDSREADAALARLSPHLRRDIGLEGESNTLVAKLISGYFQRIAGGLADPIIDNVRIANDIERRAA